jgi:recombinational DNA repair protein (RecF pathway)
MGRNPGPKHAAHSLKAEDRAQEQDPLGDLEVLERLELMDWVGEHLSYVRRVAAGQRPVYWILALGSVIGLLAHAGGYELRTTTTGEPLGLIADLLYALGFALWTGVVVVVFVQILPEAKRRQYKAALDFYEAALRERAETGGDKRQK